MVAGEPNRILLTTTQRTFAGSPSRRSDRCAQRNLHLDRVKASGIDLK
jgi:hypothetical protein